MNNQPKARTPHPTDIHSGLRLLALAAVAAGVILLAAAAFVLSYPGIHAVALSAGVSPRLAKLYPLIFDAMLVVACAAVLALRGAGLPSRCYAWLSMLVLLVAAATADALHATGVKLPHRPAAAVIAIIPWALVLIGFGLLLCMLRQARLRGAAAAAAQQKRAPKRSGQVPMRTGIDDLLGPRAFPGEPSASQVLARAGSAADLSADLAIDPEPGHDDPASDEADQAESLPAARVARIPRTRMEPPSGYGDPVGTLSVPPLSPAPTPPPAAFGNLGAAPGHEADELDPDGNASAGAGPAPDAGLTPGAGLTPDAESTLDGESRAAAESSHEAESQRGTETRHETETQRETETRHDAEAPHANGPAQPPLLQFDRMRSSPIPPGT